jgi:multidrug efflux pump subunit AcrB
LIGLQRLQIQDFPDMDLPTIQITASLEGAAPAQLETEVARKIEDKLASLSRLDHISTTITDGAVNINVSFELEKDPEVALSEVRNAVDSARAELPANMAAPVVSKNTSANSTLLTFSAVSPLLDEQDLSWFVDNDLNKALLSVKGIASIKRIGGLDREVHIDLNPALMAGLGVSPSTVSAQLKAAQIDSSGGQGDIGGQRQAARTLAAVGTPEALAAFNIALVDGRYVRLDQIARVSDGFGERNSLAFVNTKPVIGVQVTRSKGFSDVTVAGQVRHALKKFNSAHPEVTVTEISNSVAPIEDNYSGSMTLLVEGAVLAILVVWWFLRDWRSMLLAASALPLSIIPTFGVMYLAGYTLNTITLLSLALVVGILVDDAIVEIENIARHLRMGKTPYKAAMEAADEIGLAVIATTFTLVAVFLPTAFMTGIPGKIFRQFGVTASVAVLASLLVARLLTPMMAAYLLKGNSGEVQLESDSRLMTRYMGWVKYCLSHRRKTVILAGGVLVASLCLIPLLPTGFIPAQDNSQTRITLELPPGSTLQDTQAVSAKAVQLLAGIADVKSVFVAVGTSTAGGGMGATTSNDVRSATLTAELVARNERQAKQSAVETQMRQVLRGLSGARVSVGGAGNGEKLDITLAGDDPRALDTAAINLEPQLKSLKGIGNVTSGAALQRPEIQLKTDSARAASLGVTAQAAADTVRIATYGDYSNLLPKLNLPQRQIPVRVRIDPAQRGNLDTIGQLRVQGTAGSVAIASLGKLSMESGPAQIDRLDRLRNVSFSVELGGRTLGEVANEAAKLPALVQLPATVRRIEQGELQRQSELFSSFGTAMAIGIFCIYAVLVLLFHDFLQPATILCALPLSLGGAMLGLWVTQQSFSMPAIIGLLMLMGVVAKNSILLVEYAVMARRTHGMNRIEALIDACHKRARPILMTTIAMVVGMLPNAVGLGAEPSFRQPMAVVVIGGLITSTVLCLLVIPVVFTYVDDAERWLREKFRRERTQAAHPVSLPLSPLSIKQKVSQ